MAVNKGLEHLVEITFACMDDLAISSDVPQPSVGRRKAQIRDLGLSPVELGEQTVGRSVALPVYPRMFLGDAAAVLVQWGPFLHAFVWLIAVPLSLAAIFQAWSARSAAGERTVGWLGQLPVPAAAAVRRIGRTTAWAGT